MISGRTDPGPTGWPASWAWLAILAITVGSAGFVLLIGRNIGFTGDEMTLISRAADLDARDLLDPYVGHLVPIPLLAYGALIGTVGTSDYAPFQLLTFFAISLLGAGVLVWASRRLPQPVALVPAVLLIFFPADVLHFVAGNGFVVVLPLALGTWALVLWDRGDFRGDIGAALLLALAISTYTVGVAFAVGLLAWALLTDRRRLWVGAVPLLAYTLWRVFVASTSVDPGDVHPDWANLLLLPAWGFQSIGDILVALSGVGFDFGAARATGAATAGDLASPAFATAFFALLLWRFHRGDASTDLRAVAVIAVALFASQVLVWGSLEGRGGPGEERYLYPGAVAVLLMMVELIRPVEWSRTGLAILWSVTVLALVSACGFLLNVIDRKEAGTGVARAQVTAIRILASADAPGLERARTVVRNDFDPVATARFEGLGFEEATLSGERPYFTKAVDEFLAVALGIELEPVSRQRVVGPCRPLAPGVTPPDRATLPPGGTVLLATRDLELGLGRYGNRASRNLGLLPEGATALLKIPRDAGTVPWFLQVEPGSIGSLADLSLCRPPRT